MILAMANHTLGGYVDCTGGGVLLFRLIPQLNVSPDWRLLHLPNGVRLSVVINTPIKGETLTTSVNARLFSPARDIALIAVFAAVTAVLGIIPPIPVGPVPITAQSLGPMLAGAILGGRRGGLSQLLFVVLVAIGLPLLPGGRGSLAVLFGPTAGFILGWIAVGALIGWLTYRLGAPYRFWFGLGINILFGIVVLYIFGIAGMLLATKMTLGAALVANLPFIPGDIAKAVIAALIAKGVHAGIPGLMQAK